MKLLCSTGLSNTCDNYIFIYNNLGIAIIMSLDLNFLFFILFIVISSVFSVSESSIFSLTQTDIDDLNLKKNRKVIFLLRKSSIFLVIILIGNMTANVLTASFGSIILKKFDGKLSVVYSILIISFIIIVLSEIIPKIIALKKPVELSLAVSHIFYPAVLFTESLAAKIGLKNTNYQLRTDEAISNEELRTIIEIGKNEGEIKEKEYDFIKNFLKLSYLKAGNIMTTKDRIFGLEVNTTAYESIKFIERNHFSRIPVYFRDKDNVIGILIAKKILSKIDKPAEEKRTLNSFLIKPYFIPASKNALELFKELQRKKIHMAIVINEYGKMMGLITMEDLLEEIFGEIQDEYDAQ